MSYNIYVGNATLESSWSVEEGCSASWHVEPVALDDAPNFAYDILTENGNSRHPGYSQWSNFCVESGLYRLFYGVDARDGYNHDGGLLSVHPGCVPLTPSMLAEVTEARVRWECAHPGAIPGFDYDADWLTSADDGVRGRDAILARLLWLEWWMTWALANCERPSISNS